MNTPQLPPTYTAMRQLAIFLHLLLTVLIVGGIAIWFFTDNNGMNFINSYLQFAMQFIN